jgi:hypothetical protein
MTHLFTGFIIKKHDRDARHALMHVMSAGLQPQGTLMAGMLWMTIIWIDIPKLLCHLSMTPDHDWHDQPCFAITETGSNDVDSFDMWLPVPPFSTGLFLSPRSLF